MNREDLFEAIGTADEAMLERSEKKVNRKRNWLISATAAAACFALLFGIVWQSLGSMRVMMGHKISNQEFFWIGQPSYNVPDYSENGGNVSGMISVASTASYQFGKAKSVHAQIKEILPDIYCYPDGITAYRILRLKVLDTIVGENMPSEIYYLLPAYLSVDLMQYDSFIMTVEQVGIENFLMFNVTKKRTEAFTLLFQSERDVGVFMDVPTHLGTVMAFTDDMLDVSLWDKVGWNASKERVMEWVTDNAHDEYPGKVNRNVEDTKNAILKVYGRLRENYFFTRSEVITSDYFNWREARKALKYIDSLGIGAFMQEYDGYHAESSYRESHTDEITYTRIINGFLTNETITLYRHWSEFVDVGRSEEKNVEYSEARFTERDLKHLPDLAGFINNASTKEQPGGDKALWFYYASGRYEKYGDEVFGVASLYWGYPTGNGSYEHKTITYHLLCPDGTVHEAATRQEIDNLIAQYQS